jgi:hypothetical protein
MCRGVITVLLVVSAVGSAYASPVLFTFNDGLASGEGDIGISLYMSNGYPPLVIVNGAQVHGGDGFHSNPLDLYLWTRLQLLNPGNIRILLGVPTTSVAFDGYIFDATPGADFTFTAYGLFGQVIHQQSWNPNADGTALSYSTGALPTPAYWLNFSNQGQHDIGIDNLRLTPIPVPGAVILGSIGIGLIGSLRRRKVL